METERRRCIKAEKTGWAAFDAGWQATASAYYDDSRRAAHDADDRPLEANALALLAYQALTTGQPAAALAQASCDALGSTAPPRVTALLHERRAWTLASTSTGHLNEVERALGIAADALASDDGTSSPDWAAWADATELKIITGRCRTALGQPKQAIPVLGEALADFDDTQARDKALYLTWLAEAYLDAGEPDEAAAIVSHSLTLSTGVGSVRPAQRLRGILQRLTRYSGSLWAAALRDQATSLMPAPWPG
jgi:tetratricopeptide (TPR) repeat protein